MRDRRLEGRELREESGKGGKNSPTEGKLEVPILERGVFRK